MRYLIDVYLNSYIFFIYAIKTLSITNTKIINNNNLIHMMIVWYQYNKNML